MQRYSSDNFYAFTRGDTFVALTNAGSNGGLVKTTITYQPYPDGTKICNLCVPRVLLRVCMCVSVRVCVCVRCRFYPTTDCIVVTGGQFDGTCPYPPALSPAETHTVLVCVTCSVPAKRAMQGVFAVHLRVSVCV